MGSWCSPRDPPALANALEGLARTPARAITLAVAARARVERDYDAGRSAETLMREMGLRPFGEIEDDLPPLPPAPFTGWFPAGSGRWPAR